MDEQWRKLVDRRLIELQGYQEHEQRLKTVATGQQIPDDMVLNAYGIARVFWQSNIDRGIA